LAGSIGKYKMIDLSEKSMASWMDKLPDDVRRVIQEGDERQGEVANLSAALASATPVEVPDIIRAYPDEVRLLGRAGRLRLIGWLSGTAAGDLAPLFRRLLDEDEEGEGGDSVGIMLLEDIRAWVRLVLGPRVARNVVSEQTLDMVADAAATLEGDYIMEQGGY
jgi:hypothetical protein